MDLIRSSGIKVKASYAESVRRQLMDVGILRTDLKIRNKDGCVYLPIRNKERVPTLSSLDNTYEIGEFDFEVLPKKISDYKDIISLPPDLMEKLPTSFDVIGSIILIKLDEDLRSYQSIIGDALLKTHAHITSVYHINPVEGELRTRSVELMAGINQTKTIHKEYGLDIEVDIEKTYFNPRLANERRYIAGQVHSGEVIFDMFTGVAPFPLMIARYAKPECIVAIDKNSDAIELAKKNVKRNGINTDIRLICADAKDASMIMEEMKSNPDRIIMNLPFHSFDFFCQALHCIKNSGVIHLYRIGSEDVISDELDNIRKKANSEGFHICIDHKRAIKSYSPHEFYMGIDITAKKI